MKSYSQNIIFGDLKKLWKNWRVKYKLELVDYNTAL